VTAPLVVLNPPPQCWNVIGVRGDRSCPELAVVTHCHNCPVFATAGRRFLDAPPPPEYPDEWTARLATPEDEGPGDVLSVLAFRLADEWLALPVAVMAEVTLPRKPHRVPHRGGLLAGVVNIRGELHLCARLDLLLGITPNGDEGDADPRLLVVRMDADAWVFPVDRVDRVRRVPVSEVTRTPPTLARAAARLTRGVFGRDGRSIGLLDEARLFQALRERVR
jgi:chemotaxis-related protein WspD